MTAVQELGIVLQHDIDEQYQYQPGEIIRGNIRMKLTKPLAIRTIMVKANGEGNVSWKDDYDQVYQAIEVYVDAETPVVDTRDHEPLNLSEGEHQFNFDYILPENIPSSYIGKHGNVTYTMKVMVTGKFNETAISSEPFLVLRRSPLPAIARQQVTLQEEKRFWASCCYGKLFACLSLDKQGATPGEDIIVQAEIKNRTRSTVIAMQASLMMTTLFRAQNQRIEFQQVISKKRDEFDVGHNEGRKWNHVRLTMPPFIPETKLEYCDLIELQYFFQFRAELVGGKEFIIETPFWIGSQPQGLEIPQDATLGLRINRQWTVRAKGMIEALGEADVPSPDYDDEWDVQHVPEMRPESAVVDNPLYRQNSFLSKAVKVMPQEFIENTRL